MYNERILNILNRVDKEKYVLQALVERATLAESSLSFCNTEMHL